jgi:ferritin-like metal-binding protein YciE
VQLRALRVGSPTSGGPISELFEETLKDIYYAEKAILKALPNMAKKASSKKLQAAFTKH